MPAIVRVVCPVCGATAWWDDSPRVCTADGAALVETGLGGEADEPTVVEVRDE